MGREAAPASASGLLVSKSTNRLVRAAQVAVRGAAWGRRSTSRQQAELAVDVSAPRHTARSQRRTHSRQGTGSAWTLHCKAPCACHAPSGEALLARTSATEASAAPAAAAALVVALVSAFLPLEAQRTAPTFCAACVRKRVHVAELCARWQAPCALRRTTRTERVEAARTATAAAAADLLSMVPEKGGNGGEHEGRARICQGREEYAGSGMCSGGVCCHRQTRLHEAWGANATPCQNQRLAVQ